MQYREKKLPMSVMNRIANKPDSCKEIENKGQLRKLRSPEAIREIESRDIRPKRNEL